MSAPLMLDLFAGTGGASAAFVDAGWRVVRVDLEERPLAGLVVADVRDLWGYFPPIEPDYESATYRKSESAHTAAARAAVPWGISDAVLKAIVRHEGVSSLLDLRPFRRHRHRAATWDSRSLIAGDLFEEAPRGAPGPSPRGRR